MKPIITHERLPNVANPVKKLPDEDQDNLVTLVSAYREEK
jgi:hypothetical protein